MTPGCTLVLSVGSTLQTSSRIYEIVVERVSKSVHIYGQTAENGLCPNVQGTRKEFEKQRRRRGKPVTVGELTVALVDVRVSLGSGSVKITPALVPTQSRSRHASSAVTRRQAILCCRIMSSATEHNHHNLLHKSVDKIRAILNPQPIQKNKSKRDNVSILECIFLRISRMCSGL